MLKVIDISKHYLSQGVEVNALVNANFRLEEGEYLAIVGPSGSGKSTLSKISGLTLSASSGSLIFQGVDVAKLSNADLLALRRGNIGYTQSDPMLIDTLTVAENIELPLIYLNYSRSQRNKMVDTQLERLKLMHRKNTWAGQLSILQQQLVSLARALSVNPLLIVADEPCSRLNSIDTEELLSYMDSANSSGVAILHATYSTTLAARADRNVQLFDGHVVSDLHNGKMKG